MNKTTAWLIGVVVVAVVGYMVWQNQNSAPETMTETQTTPESSVTTENSGISVTTETVPAETEKKQAGFTMAQVAEHNTAASCYVVVGTGVYDVTEWIAKHPGGPEAIKGLCGIDGTEKFTKQHGSFQQAKDTLAGYLIGDLIQ
jgi:cytochrome b involved in lipid metabolism